MYSVDGIQLFGVQSQWNRIPKFLNGDGSKTYQDWAFNNWEVGQMLMSTYEALRLLQGKRLTTLETNAIQSRNTFTSYNTVVLESVVNTLQVGRLATSVNLRFRVKIV